MANVDRVFGFRPIKHTNGAPYNGQVNKYIFDSGDSTATFPGDLVTLAGSSVQSDLDEQYYATIKQAAANDVTVGVLMWLEPNPDNLGQMHRVASTKRVAYVADSPDLILETQEDAVGGALAAASVGLNANFIVGSGSTTTGQSGMELDSNTAATTNTLPLKVVGFVPRVDNEPGVANAKVMVTFNTHAYKNTTGVTGQ
jgi:hypothetical protein